MSNRDNPSFGQEKVTVRSGVHIYASRKNDGPANLRDRPEENSRCTYRRHPLKIEGGDSGENL